MTFECSHMLDPALGVSGPTQVVELQVAQCVWPTAVHHHFHTSSTSVTQYNHGILVWAQHLTVFAKLICASLFILLPETQKVSSLLKFTGRLVNGVIFIEGFCVVRVWLIIHNSNLEIQEFPLFIWKWNAHSSLHTFSIIHFQDRNI